jgi:RNA polymerase sigma-70 factor, ECF subfamily
MDHASSTSTRMDQARERALVARSRVDASAFGELYDFYLPRIHAFILRRVRDRSAAEDLTAMTFERALGIVRRDAFRNESFGGWLYRVAANAIVDHVRRESRTVPLDVGSRAARGPDGRGRGGRSDSDAPWSGDAFDGGSVLGDAAAAREFAAAIDRDTLRRGLLALPENHRRVIVLRFLDGLEPDELCSVLVCSRATLAVRLHRALRALRDAVARESIDAA